MPSEHPLTLPRRDPEHIDLGAIKTDLKFLMKQMSRLPTRTEPALRPPDDFVKVHWRANGLMGSTSQDRTATGPLSLAVIDPPGSLLRLPLSGAWLRL